MASSATHPPALVNLLKIGLTNEPRLTEPSGHVNKAVTVAQQTSRHCHLEIDRSRRLLPGGNGVMRLSQANLGKLPTHIRQPRYDRQATKLGIVHLVSARSIGLIRPS